MTLALILAAAAAEAAAPGSASAQGLDLKGMNFIDGDTIKTIFAFLGMAVTGLFTYLKMKSVQDKKEVELRTKIANELQAKITNDPLHVAKVQSCVSIGECNRRMKDLDERVTRLEAKFDDGISKIMDKLSAMDREGEQRAVALHRRIDAISEKTSETAGAVELIKAKMFKRS